MVGKNGKIFYQWSTFGALCYSSLLPTLAYFSMIAFVCHKILEI